ncbi:DctP family TRAP transporter solute-binding subunit [Virgibacillus ndiopensis]|uniref:DctP family TRAP transporter solute-binding subunit n=1 Tax=Virgibacillus ndiopensis TaxID=2004408 RepID=UPI001FEBB0AD|nr:DctP family TRAP transporter solute-binding subunit [Virgibacillus ndiopensis]
MRNIFIILTFIITGLVSAVMIGFDMDSIQTTKDYDDEQEGLDEQIIIRFSHVVAKNTPKGRTAQRFAELVEDKTNGKVKVHIFPNATLYNDTNEWEAIQNGNVEMIAPATAKLTDRFPTWQVLDLPFAFPTQQAVVAAYEGEIGQTLMEELNGTNVKGMTFWYNNFKQITNQTRPILQPSDFNRLHFRVMPSPVIEEQYDQLNASTSTLPFNKTYRNLEVNFVDGQENTVSNIYTKKFYQHQKYMTISNHAYLGYGVLINREFWDSLSNEVQLSIKDAMQEATEWGRRHSIEMNDKDIRELKLLKTIDIHILSTEERDQWKKALKPVYEKITPIVGNNLMDEIYRIQEEYAY